MKHIVKRAGHAESYDVRKLYASIYSACMAVRGKQQTAETIADNVCKQFEEWLGTKHEVTSKDILHKASSILVQFNEDAAWIYKHHRNVS